MGIANEEIVFAIITAKGSMSIPYKFSGFDAAIWVRKAPLPQQGSKKRLSFDRQISLVMSDTICSSV